MLLSIFVLACEDRVRKKKENKFKKWGEEGWKQREEKESWKADLHLQTKSLSKTESNKWLLIPQWEVAREVRIYAEQVEWFSGGPMSFVNFPYINSQAEIQVF